MTASIYPFFSCLTFFICFSVHNSCRLLPFNSAINPGISCCVTYYFALLIIINQITYKQASQFKRKGQEQARFICFKISFFLPSICFHAGFEDERLIFLKKKLSKTLPAGHCSTRQSVFFKKNQNFTSSSIFLGRYCKKLFRSKEIFSLKPVVTGRRAVNFLFQILWTEHFA